MDAFFHRGDCYATLRICTCAHGGSQPNFKSMPEDANATYKMAFSRLPIMYDPY